MASTQTNVDLTTGPAPAPAGNLLISLPPLPAEALDATLTNLALAFPGNNILVATPDAVPQLSAGSPIHLLPYAPTVVSSSPWVLTAADYLNAFRLAQDNHSPACLLLGAEAHSLTPEAIQALAKSASTSDLSVARYHLGAREGLVNSAILYPVTRAVFGTRPRFPLAIDLGLSLRMAERLATTAQRFTAASQNDSMIWPVAEAAVANFSIAEVEVGPRTIPQPAAPDLNALLSQIAGSLFADIDAKASFWQRARVTAATPPASSNAAAEAPPDIASMLETFRLAYTNLISSGTASEKHIQDLAVAFEADKPYLVSRWRWPDRFNP
jgi:glucosylglycerate synthase